MKTAIVFCVGANDHSGNQDFYVKVDNVDYFLFRQSYRKGIKEYFGNGVHIDKALKNNWNKLDRAVLRTIDKLPSYIKYVEKEYGVAILDKTRRAMG